MKVILRIASLIPINGQTSGFNGIARRGIWYLAFTLPNSHLTLSR